MRRRRLPGGSLARRLYACLAVAILLLPGAAAATAPLTVATDENLAPLSFAEHGRPAGIDVDMLREAAQRLALPIHIQPLPWKRVLQQLRDGEVALGMPLFDTAQRRAYAEFIAPVHYSDLGLFVRRGEAFDFSGIDALRGRRIGLMRGFALRSDLDHAIAAGDVDAEEASTLQQNLAKLLRGRIDVFICTVDSMRYALGREPDAGRIQMLPELLWRHRPAYLVASRQIAPAPDASRLQALGRMLLRLHADGTYDRIAAHYGVAGTPGPALP